MSSPSVSLVVPLYGASARFSALRDALSRTMEEAPELVEVVLVDDGSDDDTWEQISAFAQVDPRVLGVRLAANAGQTNALGAGLSLAGGDVVVIMDDDLEIPPIEFRPLVAAVAAGSEFASGRRVGPRPTVRAWSSRLYNARLRSWGMPFHDAGCGFNAMSRDLGRQLSREGWNIRLHRFKPRVFELTERIVEVDLPVRRQPASHYGLLDLSASWLDIEKRFGPLTEQALWRRLVIAPAAFGAAVAGVGVAGRSAVLVGWGGLLAGSAALLSRAFRESSRIDRETAVRDAWVIAEVAGSTA